MWHLRGQWWWILIKILYLVSQRIQLKSLNISQQKILLDSMLNFNEDFSCRSLLRLPANSIEELIYHSKNFLLNSVANFDQDFACFSCGDLRKDYHVSIYILFSQKPFANKKGKSTAPELTALPIHLWLLLVIYYFYIYLTLFLR